MTTMVRLTIDLPAATPLQHLQRLAEQANGRLFRRPDGTFVVRPIEPTQQTKKRHG